MSTQLANLKKDITEARQKAKPIEQVIQASINELGKALPAHLSAERLVRIALTTLRLNPALAECTNQSFLAALFQSAQLGLEPNIEGQAYLIPFTNSRKISGVWQKIKEVQFIIGYKGYVELFYRHELSVCIDMQPVYENDLFEYQYGTNAYLRHIPVLRNRGKIVAFYALATLKNGGTPFKVMPKEECIEHGKKHSKCFDKEKNAFAKNTPWDSFEDEMCLVVVLKKLMKLLPKSPEIRQALAMDGTTKSRIDVDMLTVKDETNWNEPVLEVTAETEAVTIEEKVDNDGNI